MNERGKTAVFFPFVTEGQLLSEIQGLPQPIIIIQGLDPAAKAFKDLEMNAWHRYGKVIVAENIRGMVESFPDQFLDMYRASHPRNPNLPSLQERITTDPEDRYAKFVELVNQRLTMKELAMALGLSVPATYLIRTQYKQRLLDDENVIKSAPAMKFHKGK